MNAVMKKIINSPEDYVDDMLAGIYAAHADSVHPVADDLRPSLDTNTMKV